jgi:hypothetical protein
MKISTKPVPLYVVRKGELFIGCTTSQSLATGMKLATAGATMEARVIKSANVGCVAGILLSLTGGASKGGLARSANLTAKRRSEIAAKANAARWAKHKKGTK